MLKLMKYEFRKQAFSKAVILILVGVLEIIFFYGVFADKENTIALSMSLLALFAAGAMFFIAFESILTFSNDLKQKCSYMLFLTPNTSYGIVGAKVLAAGIQVIIAAVVFFLVFALDGTVLLAKYESLADFKQFIEELLRELFKLNIALSDVISVVSLFVTSWISTITVAFFSITLSTTFLANSKFKGVLSFAIFIALTMIFNKLMNMLLQTPVESSKMTLYFALSSACMLIFTIITYVGTAWMLDKKVSV
ncbi:MAG: hypothetical protein GX913_04680 [Clostridiales bacterium]|nr:hypothetical protein [Clostridiales bacterium]